MDERRSFQLKVKAIRVPIPDFPVRIRIRWGGGKESSFSCLMSSWLKLSAAGELAEDFKAKLTPSLVLAGYLSSLRLWREEAAY